MKPFFLYLLFGNVTVTTLPYQKLDYHPVLWWKPKILSETTWIHSLIAKRKWKQSVTIMDNFWQSMVLIGNKRNQTLNFLLLVIGLILPEINLDILCENLTNKKPKVWRERFYCLSSTLLFVVRHFRSGQCYCLWFIYISWNLAITFELEFRYRKKWTQKFLKAD